MKVKFVTCIYNNLYGSEYGGRPGRSVHYLYSLLNILNITDAKFVLYTAPHEYQEMVNFFHNHKNISKEQLTIKSFDLKESWYFDKIRSNKDLDKIKTIDRCYEIQYNKFYWLNQEIDDEHTHFYWIDAGLSHIGLFPSKYSTSNLSPERYYFYNVFNNKFLNKLVEFSSDKVFVIGKDNTHGNYWSSSLPERYFTKFDKSVHIIGGLFGGIRSAVVEYIDLFDKLLLQVLDSKELYYEELLMSNLYFEHLDKFIMKYFNIWWYEENGLYPVGHKIYKNNKSFYKIFEELLE